MTLNGHADGRIRVLRSAHELLLERLAVDWWCSAFGHDDVRDDLVIAAPIRIPLACKSPKKVFHAVNSGRSR